jgi:ankyrin repeat protein
MNNTTLPLWLAQHGFSGKDLNAVGASGLTPLMRAARLGDLDKIDALLRLGVDLAARNGDGNNALWFACVGEHFDAIALLLERGIDIDNQNDNGATCLMYAASTGKDAVVQTLLAAGANDKLKSLDDFTALDVAATLDCLQLLRYTATA